MTRSRHSGGLLAQLSFLTLAAIASSACTSARGDGGSRSLSEGASTCDPNAWVYMGNDPNACSGNLDESCGWTTTNEGQGFTCQQESYGPHCEPNGTVCPGGSASGSSGGSGSSGSSSCDPNAWVYMGNDPNACSGNLDESCGWTTTNEGQGFTCQQESYGPHCEPNGTVCPGGSASGSSGGSGSSGSSSCDPNAWVYMGNDPNACSGNLDESCGWTTTNLGQGFTCQEESYGPDCEPSGTVCPGGSGSSGGTGSSSGSGSSSGGSSGSGFGAIVSSDLFSQMFPNADPFYSYSGLVAATANFPTFANQGTSDDQKRDIAAFLANVAHETGGLIYINEIQTASYCDSSDTSCPCAPGQEYFGRGPIQISWNSNYCAASQFIFGDQDTLRLNPGLVATDAPTSWATGLWFWTQTPCESDIVNDQSFGETINVVNGPIECNGGNPTEVQDRVNYYLQFCNLLGVSPGSGAQSC